MKNLVTVIIFTMFSIGIYSQEKMDAVKTVDIDTTTVIKEIPTLNTNLVLSNTAKKKLLIQNNFDKSTFLFRGKKSKREKLC